MGNPGESSPRKAFGEFELDLHTREVWTNGGKFDLQEQPFQVLCALLERPSQLVTREELTKRLWSADTFVDYEHALNRVIKRLREALNDSADEPRFIQTLPRRGYRFIAPVEQVMPRQLGETRHSTAGSTGEGSAASRLVVLQTTVEPAELVDRNAQASAHIRPWYRQAVFLLITLGLGSLAGWLTYWLLSPPPTVRVTRSTKIATSSKLDPWGLLVTDGTRIYFLEREGSRWNLAQTSTSGGDPQIVPTPFPNTRVLAVSPNRDKLLIGTFTSRSDRMPFWIWPVQGGAPKRVGEAFGYDAIWTPNGRQIIYGENDGIYETDEDGSNAHKFVTTDGVPGLFAWSPDGRFLRFTVSSLRDETRSLWQVNSDATDLHALQLGWTAVPDEACGFWSPDGHYFFFLSNHAKSMDIWVVREKASLLHRHQNEPYRLTTGPVDIWFVMPSADGHKLYALGGSERTEFMRYDLQTRQFIPLPVPKPAFDIHYSPDGAWMAYTSSPESTLIVSKPDGTQPISVPLPGMRAGWAAWSPDARQLAVDVLKADGSLTIVVVPVAGGLPIEVSADTQKKQEASWSPDGSLIAFSSFKNAANEGASIQLYNVATKEVSLLSGSVGLRSPHWSPDGRFLSAVSQDLHRLMLLDLQTRRWTELANGVLLNGGGVWSKDGKELFYQDWLATDEPIFKIRMSDHKRELVTTMESLLRIGSQRVGLMGRAPDGNLILGLDRGGADIYALDLDTQ